MIINRAVLNSDTVNRYGDQFTIGSLENVLELKALEGVPTNIGHDIHKPIGWTVPFGLYFEPGMCRLVGYQHIAETEEEQKNIAIAHERAIEKRYSEECGPYLEEFKKILGSHLSETGTYIYTSCVCYCDENIVEKILPSVFASQDKDGLVYLSDLLIDFDYRGHGVFIHKKSDLAISAHSYFRRSLSRHNNLNYYFLDELLDNISNPKITVRLSIDRNLIGIGSTCIEPIELEYWRGPKFNEDITQIKLGVSEHRSSEFQRLYYGITNTEFWWKDQDGMKTLEAEELKDNPAPGLEGDNYCCRYVHSIFDDASHSFEHFDGAIRTYDTEKMIGRIEKDIKSAGKNSIYTKLFRIDGQLPIANWKSLICNYFQNNPLVPEYFNEKIEQPSFIDEEIPATVLEKLLPFSMQAGQGIRLLVSYHPINENYKRITAERFVSGFDVLRIGDAKQKVVELDIREIKKALNRLSGELTIPDDIEFITSEDLYWNIPKIHHQYNERLEFNISQTLQSLTMIFEGIVKKEGDKVASLNFEWDTETSKRISISVMGHCSDILDWLKQNSSIPIDKEKFRDWLEAQSIYLKKYSILEDQPPLFETLRMDGVLYMRRRTVKDPIKVEFKYDDQNREGYEIKIPIDQEDLAEAFGQGSLTIAREFIIKASTCSMCQSDYNTCSHSKYLDDDVSEVVKEAQQISITWTDRRT